MNRLLERLGGFAARRHWIVIATWIDHPRWPDRGEGTSSAARYVNDYTVPGSNSSNGLNLLNSDYPQQGGYGGQIVFHASHGTVADQATAVNQATGNVASCST